MHSLLAGLLLHYIKIITCYILWGMMLDLQTRQNNNFIHDDARTCACTHTNTQLHTLLSTINICFAQIFDFLHWFDGIRNNNNLEWKGEMHFFEWLRQIFVLVLMSKRIINLKFPLLWMNWCLLKLFIFIMIYEKVAIAMLIDFIYISYSEIHNDDNL